MLSFNRSVGCLLLLIGRVLSAQCYYPDGSIAKNYNYTECGGGESACCIPASGDRCLSNGLCFWPSGNYPYRGACTDQSWQSGKCSSYCKSSSPMTWDKLVSCGDTKYCCSGGGSDCCNKSDLVFDIGRPSIINDYGAAFTSTAVFSIITATSGASSSYSTDSSESRQTPGPRYGPPPRQDQNKGMGTGALVGIGAGVATFLVLLIAGLGVYCCIRKKAKKATSQPQIALIGGQEQKSDMHGTPISSPGWAPGTPAPPYSEYYGQNVPGLKGPHGQNVYELQSPVPPQPVIHELHSPAQPPMRRDQKVVHELA